MLCGVLLLLLLLLLLLRQERGAFATVGKSSCITSKQGKDHNVS